MRIQILIFSQQEADTESSENPVANGKEIESEDSESHSHHVSVMDVLGAKSAEKIAEKLESLEEVTEIMRLAGLESSNLIFGEENYVKIRIKIVIVVLY